MQCNDLSCYVCTEFLLACAVLDHYICTHLVVLKSDKLKRYDVCSLMQELIEGMLSICSWLSEDNRSLSHNLQAHRNGYRFSVRFHIKLLQMCREAAECL